MIYEVKNVHGEPREWSSSHGSTFLSYTVDFINEDGVGESGVEWTKKPESQPPTVGERVAGHIEPGRFAEKFKIDYEATKELGQQGGSRPRSSEASTSNTSKGEVDWDAKEARITRQAVLKVLSPTINQEGLSSGVRTTVEELEQFITEAPRRPLGEGQTASQVDAQAPPVNETPIDFTGARTEEPNAIQDLDEYRQLLWNAGLEPAAARDKVAEYIAVVLPPDRRTKALSGLQDLDRQGTVLAQLKTETEEWTKQPLPQGDALDEDIPF